MLREAGDEEGARKAEAELARTSWYIQYTDRPGHTAQPESARTLVKAEAQALLRKRVDAVRQGQSDPSAVDRLVVQNLCDDLLRHYEVNGIATLRDAQTRVKLHLLPFFGAMKAVRLRNTHCQEYIALRRKEGATDASIVNELGLVKRAFKLAVQNGKLPTAPYIAFPVGYDHPRTGFLEHEQFKRLMGFLPEWLRPLTSLAFHSAMRRGELLSLRWSQVDLVEGTISLSGADTKTGEPRTVPVAEEPLAMLRTLKVLRDQLDPTFELVFFRPRAWNEKARSGPGAILPVRDFNGQWARACCAAKLGEMDGPSYRGLIFHDLRRSGIRQLIRSGVHEHTAMAISGHKTRSVFLRYNIVSLDDLRDATKKLDAHLAPEPEQQAEPPAPEHRELGSKLVQ